MPAKSRSLGFPCPDIDCRLEYGSICVEKQKEDWLDSNKKRNRAHGKTHQSYRKKQRIELKSAEIALKNIIESRYEKFLAGSFDNPAFAKLLSLIQDPEKQKEVKEIAKNITTYVQTRESLEQKEIKEEEIKYAKWNVVEELDTNSREYRLTKQIRKVTRATNILELQDQNHQDDEEKDGESGKKIITWNPIKEIKRYRRTGDIIRHLDLDSIWDFIASKVAVKYPNVMAMFLSDENRSVIKKIFDVTNKYREQFSNKNWCYLWLEWFWIVRYSQVETPRMAAKMLEALDGEKGKISSRQIKNRKESTLKFLEEFFYYFRLFLLFELYTLQIIKEDEFLKKEYEDLLKKDKEKNEVSIDNIIKKQVIYQQSNHQHILLSYNNGVNDNVSVNKDDNEDLRIKRIKQKRIRIYHYNPNYRREMEEYEKRLRDTPPWKRKRCGPFKLSELPSVAIKQLIEKGKLHD